MALVYRPIEVGTGYTLHDLGKFGLKMEAWGLLKKKGNEAYFQLDDRIKSSFSRSDRGLRLTVPRDLLENPDFIQHQEVVQAPSSTTIPIIRILRPPIRAAIQ